MLRPSLTFTLPSRKQPRPAGAHAPPIPHQTTRPGWEQHPTDIQLSKTPDTPCGVQVGGMGTGRASVGSPEDPSGSAPSATLPHPARRSRGQEMWRTLRKAKRTYIGRAVGRAGAAPVRSTSLPAASVLLGRPPSAAARWGQRPAPAGSLAACLPSVISMLGAQPVG